MSGITLACYVENISTRKDKSVKIILGTQELSEGNAGSLFGLQNKIAAVYISPKDEILQSEKDAMDAAQSGIQGKSQSQRMRSVLFLLFRQNTEGHATFEAYYLAKMEGFIESLKNRIQP